MDPQDVPPQLQFMQQQINQAMLEHQIVLQALRAQCLVSLVCVVALSLLCLFLWKRLCYSAEALVAQAKRHSTEQKEQEERHSKELLDQQRQSGLELNSITRTMWGEFADALRTRRGA
jgi:hypothetical protein